MPPRHQLTYEQRGAVESAEPRLMVVAHPGSGKTTVAAERFGHARFAVPRDRRRCLALSFTRSATWELRSRIAGRWGPKALRFPHAAMTLDAFLIEVLEGLLRTGHVSWPGGHVTLDVLDTWGGLDGAAYVPENAFRAFTLLSRRGIVVPRSLRQPERSTTAMRRVGDLRGVLEQGICTHDDIRTVLIGVLNDEGLVVVMGDQIARRSRAMVVDEIFDGNPVDIGCLRAAANAGVSVTVVGDPWQAVYQFRGADPWESRERLLAAGYVEKEIPGSFRFQPAMAELAALLRDGSGVVLVQGVAEDCDIVLATWWDLLWGVQGVLPTSVGQVRNQWDAALTVVLDVLVRGHCGHSAVFVEEAYRILRSEGADRPALLDAAVAWLSLADPDNGPGELMASLRNDLHEAGVTAQLRTPMAGKRDRYEGRILQLVAMRESRDLVTGTTVHQAKGGEWNRVGLSLTERQLLMLSRGLDRTSEEDRILYVALTRARSAVRVVRPFSMDASV